MRTPSVYELEKIPLRPLIYGAVLIYLLLDFFVVHGPLRQRIENLRTPQDIGIANGWAALVNEQEPITKAQLNLAMDIYLARRGESRKGMSAKNLSNVQILVMDRLINDALVKLWSEGYPVETPPEFIAARIDQFKAHFPPAKLREICERHDLSQSQLERLVAAQARQEYWLEEMIKEGLVVTESEIRQWYDAYRDHLKAPETVRARHVFLSTVENDTPERESLIRGIHQQLVSGSATFEALAAQHSEDLRTKQSGGDLSYFSRDRMPADFCDVVFALQPGEVSAPFRTKLGWHIVQLTERLPGRPLTYEEAREEIRVHLENLKRDRSVDEFLYTQLRTATRAHVTRFPAAWELDLEE